MASPIGTVTIGKPGAALSAARGGEDFLRYAPIDTVATLERSQHQLKESRRILGDSGASPDDLKLWMPRRAPDDFT